MNLNNESNKIVNQQYVYSIAGNLKKPNIYCQYVEKLENLLKERKNIITKLKTSTNKDAYNKINLEYNINVNMVSENFIEFEKLLNDEINSYLTKLKNLYEQNYYGNELFKLIKFNYNNPYFNIEKNIYNIEPYSKENFEKLYKKKLQTLMFNFKNKKKDEEILIDLKRAFNMLDSLKIHNDLEKDNKFIKNDLLNLIISNKNLDEKDLEVISEFLNAHKIIKKNDFNQIINKNKPTNLNKQLSEIKEESAIREESEEKPVINEAFLSQLEEDANNLGPYIENLEGKIAKFEKENKNLKKENAKLIKENKNLEKELIKARKLIDELLNNSATLNKSYNKDSNVKKSQDFNQKFNQSYNRSSKK